MVVSAAGRWREEKVKFIAQLGDIVDSKAKRNDSSEADCQNVLAELHKSKSEYLVNIIGNHELYNFSRTKLDELLDVKRGGLDTWHTFLPVTGSKLRVVVLDPYQVSTIQGSTEENTKSAFDYLHKHNPNDITK